MKKLKKNQIQEIWTSPNFEQTQKFPSRFRSFRKYNKLKPKNMNKPKLRAPKIK